MSVEMQINDLPAALRYRVSSRLLFKIPNQVPNSMPITMQITIPNTMQYLFQSYITENTIPKKIPTQTRRSRATQLRCQSTTANQVPNEALPIDVPYEAIWSVADGATTFKRGGWSYRHFKKPRPQTISVPDVQESNTRTTISQPSQVKWWQSHLQMNR